MAIKARNRFSSNLSQLYASPKKEKQLVQQLNMKESTDTTQSISSSNTSTDDSLRSLLQNYQKPVIISYEVFSDGSCSSLDTSSIATPMSSKNKKDTVHDSFGKKQDTSSHDSFALEDTSSDASSVDSQDSLCWSLDANSDVSISTFQESRSFLGSSCSTAKCIDTCTTTTCSTTKCGSTCTGSWASSILLQDEDNLPHGILLDSFSTINSDDSSEFDQNEDESSALDMFSWAETFPPKKEEK